MVYQYGCGRPELWACYNAVPIASVPVMRLCNVDGLLWSALMTEGDLDSAICGSGGQ